MKLIDLNPRWVGAGGEGVSDAQGRPVPARQGVGLMFECPCRCGETIYVAFRQPLDGGAPCLTNAQAPTWERTGDTFETLTLLPSILRMTGCRWHGFVTAGQVSTC